MTSGCSPDFLFFFCFISSDFLFLFVLIMSVLFSRVHVFPSLSNSYRPSFSFKFFPPFVWLTALVAGVLWPLEKCSNISVCGCRVDQLTAAVKLSMWRGCCPDMWYPHLNARLASHGCQHAEPRPQLAKQTHILHSRSCRALANADISARRRLSVHSRVEIES